MYFSVRGKAVKVQTLTSVKSRGRDLAEVCMNKYPTNVTEQKQHCKEEQLKVSPQQRKSLFMTYINVMIHTLENLSFLHRLYIKFCLKK